MVVNKSGKNHLPTIAIIVVILSTLLLGVLLILNPFLPFGNGLEKFSGLHRQIAERAIATAKLTKGPGPEPRYVAIGVAKANAGGFCSYGLSEGSGSIPYAPKEKRYIVGLEEWLLFWRVNIFRITVCLE